MIGDKSEWGQGYAREAIAALSDYAFETLSLRKLSAGCYEPNIGSRKAFLSADFVVEAVRKQHFNCNGERVDGILMGRLHPELSA